MRGRRGTRSKSTRCAPGDSQVIRPRGASSGSRASTRLRSIRSSRLSRVASTVGANSSTLLRPDEHGVAEDFAFEGGVFRPAGGLDGAGGDGDEVAEELRAGRFACPDQAPLEAHPCRHGLRGHNGRRSASLGDQRFQDLPRPMLHPCKSRRGSGAFRPTCGSRLRQASSSRCSRASSRSGASSARCTPSLLSARCVLSRRGSCAVVSAAVRRTRRRPRLRTRTDGAAQEAARSRGRTMARRSGSGGSFVVGAKYW